MVTMLRLESSMGIQNTLTNQILCMLLLLLYYLLLLLISLFVNLFGFTRTRERKSAQKSIGLVNKSTRLVDFASCQRAVKYAETFHTKDDGSDGGVLPRSRAVWFDGRRCRM
jgi:hypothetical protein